VIRAILVARVKPHPRQFGFQFFRLKILQVSPSRLILCLRLPEPCCCRRIHRCPANMDGLAGLIVVCLSNRGGIEQV
jgi:hypothetical protein